VGRKWERKKGGKNGVMVHKLRGMDSGRRRTWSKPTLKINHRDFEVIDREKGYTSSLFILCVYIFSFSYPFFFLSLPPVPVHVLFLGRLARKFGRMPR
jgi:hypothetical protein